MTEASAMFEAVDTTPSNYDARYVECSRLYRDDRPPNTTSSRRRGLTVTTRKCPDILEIRYTPFFVPPEGTTSNLD